MLDQPALISIRFKSSRSTLTGCHVTGVVYPVTPDFARQVVEVEGVAEYVEAEPVSSEADSGRAGRRKR